MPARARSALSPSAATQHLTFLEPSAPSDRAPSRWRWRTIGSSCSIRTTRSPAIRSPETGSRRRSANRASSLGDASEGPSTINARPRGRIPVRHRACRQRARRRSRGRERVVSRPPDGRFERRRSIRLRSHEPRSTDRVRGGRGRGLVVPVRWRRDLSLVTSSLSTKQAAPCWLVLTETALRLRCQRRQRFDRRLCRLAERRADPAFGSRPHRRHQRLRRDAARHGHHSRRQVPLRVQTGTGTVGAFAIDARGSARDASGHAGPCAVAGFPRPGRVLVHLHHHGHHVCLQ